MDEQPLVVLDSAACWRLLGDAEVGRLAVAPAGDVDIFPVNFVVHDGCLYFRTAPGSKLFELSVNPAVALEIDGWDDRSAYSVVVKGTAERLESQAEIDSADRLPLAPWLPTPKYRWVRIRPGLISGRSFLRGVEPERY
ncbi:nitroimidazol reductase NimA-like FMN-containing flavoprotein (pyridoxamine 5'-phosphate oxidase superfamily) [Leifsonia sp. AK011]|uniref:pyridoxamine 5'-phosphate oxidase family protein n=1 Tax=Leifsonia sp. AK011 TaxID=2723075 RepID=UPI0015CA77D1|nr:pyridoxamine 5'-phosphate oxidase family protein [Leifsonia sp. AK011]NYF09012.1 nitroimidazol reductase NimA-like FMN-containing flavoprotein (pyridoxamine 5'-phosphate oxidase superfamily) [Leifsonia sp. AK011]